MQIVSTEPIVLIGPGSEWFWTAISGVVLAITFIAIWRQPSLARSVNAFEQLTRLEDEWGSEAMTRAKLAVARAILAGGQPPIGALGFVVNFCERLASLVRAGHVGERVVYESTGPSIRYWWALLAATVARIRQDESDDTFLVNFEWLENRFAEFASKDGVRTLDYSDPAEVLRVLPNGIAGYEDRLQLLEDMRAEAGAHKRPTRG
jgi:Domain of unknown function (DUF4760)